MNTPIDVWIIKNLPRLALLAICLFVSVFGVPGLSKPQPVFADEYEPDEFELYELTDNRTADSKLYQIGEHKYRLEKSTGDIHYYASGEWLDIDPDYYYEYNEPEYTAMFMNMPYMVYVTNDSSRRIYPDRNDLSYWIQLYKPFPNMGLPQKAGGYWYWNFNNAIIAVRVQNTGVKFAFRLKNDSAPSSITIPFETQGITREGRYLYHDGELIAVMKVPYAVDANGIERECDIEFEPGEVTVSLDTTGLAYPIDIDPSIETQVGASANDAYELGNGATSYVTTSLYIYSVADPGDVTSSSYRASGLRFTGLSDLVGVTVDNATLAVSRTTNEDDPNCVIYGNDVDTSANYSADTNIISRTRTTASVSWVDTAIPAGWNNIEGVETIIQEVIDRPGWDTDSLAMMFIPNTDAAFLCRIVAQDAGDGYAAKLYIDYTSGGGAPDITNIPVSEALGILLPSSTYYASASGAPSNPVQDGECTFTVNNTSPDTTANITIKCTNFIGGGGWTLTSGAPGSGQIRITAYYSGQNPANGIVLTTAEQDFCTLAGSTSLKWDFKIETGTFPDFIAKSGNITLTSYEL